MTTSMQVMLAGKLEWERLKYPCLSSPKIDGLRCFIKDGKPLSRSAKLLPNQHLQEQVEKYADVLEGLDGELVVGDPTSKEAFNATMTRGITTAWSKPDFTYLVFDMVDAARPYVQRLKSLRELKSLPPWVTLVKQSRCDNQDEVEAMEQVYLTEGYEGLMARDPRAPYKHGRSTSAQSWLVKLKRYLDAEAMVIGFTELYHNENEAVIDARGLTTRSSHQQNQVAGGIMGALTCSLLSDPTIVFGIGTGFDYAERSYIWRHRHEFINRIVKFKYLPHGTLEATGVPRHPVFLGWRDPIDI